MIHQSRTSGRLRDGTGENFTGNLLHAEGHRQLEQFPKTGLNKKTVRCCNGKMTRLGLWKDEIKRDKALQLHKLSVKPEKL